MLKVFKFFTLLFALLITSNVHSKPIPPGAGSGDVAANILFLVDSSASMGRWIGDDGLFQATGVSSDQAGNIYIGQNNRASQSAIMRYTSAGEVDNTFSRFRSVPNNCFDRLETNRGFRRNNLRAVSTVQVVNNVTTNAITTAEEIVFMNVRDRRMNNQLYGFSTNGSTCRIAVGAPGNAVIHDFDVKIINNTTFVFMSGRVGRRVGFFKTCNLNTRACRTQTWRDRNHITRTSHRISVNSDASSIYLTDSRGGGDLVEYSLNANGGAYQLGTQTRRCEAVNNPNLQTQLMYASNVQVSPENDNIIYITSHINHALQKIQLTGTGCTVVTSVGIGTQAFGRNNGTANDLDADLVGFSGAWGLNVTNTRILTSTNRGYVDEFDEDLFTVAARDTTWLQQMGGPRIRRWDGVKDAIRAVVNDSTLTTGAHFGFGHWNAGESGRGKHSFRGGKFCHNNDGCTYYGNGWVGNHPEGRSAQCNTDSCINVGVSARGAGKIMEVFQPLGMAWGTDANAFSMMAQKYFEDTNAGKAIYDPQAECQLNYVIVIGDGAMKNTGVLQQRGQSAARMAALREKGIKSLYVAYGGGISGTNLNRFHELSRIGTSTLPAGTTEQQCVDDDDCERAIEADTPEDLQQALSSKIRQIIATRLAFTAPSITATIQEGGSLYQAQFEYSQFSEWEGTILRKKIKATNCNDPVEGDVDCVFHDTTRGNAHGNWSAAVEIYDQSKNGEEVDERNIWSAMPNAPYLGNWDNFNVANSDAIRSLFATFGVEVGDYHHDGSFCDNKGDFVNNDALKDEVIGLINFMKGNDYFDYDGDCRVLEKRNHVMGDVYHSQLIEVGAPDANLVFGKNNEEAYYRVKNGYQKFMSENRDRRNIIYAGANSGILHAINAKTGKEEWGFIPPFVGAFLPTIINPDLDGNVNPPPPDPNNPQQQQLGEDRGGTNPIFGVDGSPVVHDLFIRGYSQDGTLEGSKSWRTILFVPYGRGGAGFSVLDITFPIPIGGQGPIHMFSIFNDRINNRVLLADIDGEIEEFPYNPTTTSLENSSEGVRAIDNYQDYRIQDGDTSTTLQDNNAACDRTSGADFKDNGTATCYTGNTFHFPDFDLEYPVNTEIPDGILSARQIINNIPTPVAITSAQIINEDGTNLLKVVFNGDKTFNANQSDANNTAPDQISIDVCIGGSGITPEYNYTSLGETWGTPKIIRMPSSSNSNLEDDRYVAILPSGLAKNNACGASGIYLVDLEAHADKDSPGRIFGADINGGPIPIVDTAPDGVSIGTEVLSTPNGSDIANAIPASPIVITPDTAPNIPWRGAMVYINDLEGKITKINLSNNTKGFNNNGDLIDGVTSLYDQTTLFRINGNEDNERYSYFGMDAGLGVSDGGFWLFGSTGNFTNLGSREDTIDNILYGVRDLHYPYWRHLNNSTIPKAMSKGAGGDMVPNTNFLKLAHAGANNTQFYVGSRDVASNTCVNVSGSGIGGGGIFSDEVTNNTDTVANATVGDGDAGNQGCPLPSEKTSWVIHLEQDASYQFEDIRTYRKASAPPTLFKGKVYFPIYQPPVGDGSLKCEQGNAFICATDEECGINESAKLDTPDDLPGGVPDSANNSCAYVRGGVLSELVAFSDNLFANVAGPSEDISTLFKVLSVPGDIITNKGGWRDSSF